MNDQEYMKRALALAERGCGWTSPNPMVGAVIVRDGRILAEGWHARYGELHAERAALANATEDVRGATMYVTLEPCCHHGKQPPCTDAIIESGIARVVVGSPDPNPLVAGKGVAILREHGIVVEENVLREACDALNAVFFHYIREKQPFVVLKTAMTLDGKIATRTGASKWVTGEAARAHGHSLRHRYRAIMVGSGTVLADDPRLTVRLAEHAPQLSSSADGQDCKPLRVVLDRTLRMPSGAHVLDGSAPTLVFHAASAQVPRAGFERVELMAVETRDGHLDLAQVLAELGKRGVNELQVEAGATLCGALFAAGLVDELLLYVAPLFLGDAARPLLALPALTDMAARWRLRVVEQRQVGDDLRLLLRP